MTERGTMTDPVPLTAHAPLPTPRTVWLRTFLPWQLIRFCWLNVRMIRMVGRAH